MVRKDNKNLAEEHQCLETMLSEARNCVIQTGKSMRAELQDAMR